MTHILRFDEDRSDVHELVGGKGRNLGLLAQAGFDVPPGFTVTTDAYVDFLADNRIDEKLTQLVSEIDYSDAEKVEAVTAGIRELIVGAAFPDALATGVQQAYEALGASYVAVRSSGTAEDLAEASFAGLHDTYLDVLGPDAVLNAVQRCWASLWTGRAVSYRHDKGFDQAGARIAVVIQTMVESEVSGVMFTGNPMTTATDEIVINSSWGLGEAVVGGIVTPDEFVVKSGTLQVLERKAGDKEIRIVRDRETGNGTITEEVPVPEREKLTLTDEQLGELADLGRRVQAHYEDFPQDLEWAFAGDRLYLLQSRPITGVEFSWDAEVNASFPAGMIEDEDCIWTRAFADEVNTGIAAPLTFTARYEHTQLSGWGGAAKLVGLEHLVRTRLFKYHKGLYYYNTRWERQIIEKVGIPALRPSQLAWASPLDTEEILKAPFSYADYLRFYLKVTLIESDRGPLGLLKRIEYWRTERFEETAGLPTETLRGLSDEELLGYTQRILHLEDDYQGEVCVGFYLYFRDAMGLMALTLQHWYDGPDPMGTFGQLIAGSRVQTDTQRENLDLWRFAQRIRRSEVLSEVFENYQNEAFFAELENSEDGRAFLADYRPWAQMYGHRGEADRDMVYPRRCEDQSLDYVSFRTFLSATEAGDPAASEAETNRRREEAFAAVVESIRRSQLGFAKAQAFTFLYDLVHKWIAARDNQRQNPLDRLMMALKRGFLEIGRRLHERGLIDEPDGFHYLSKKELFDLFAGHTTNLKLVRAKIAARRRDCDRIINGDADMPEYLHRGRAVDLSTGGADDDGEGRFRGTGTSPGTVTGTARVVPRLADVGKVKPGDILVAHGTDPGWTPVFLILSGVLVQTGGLLSHASCLAREYGMPAVQLSNAMKLIPDGATITINGTSGEVTIDDPVAAAAETGDAQ